MPKKQSTELTTQMSNETLELLKQSYPVEQGFQRTLLPRLGMFSQNVTEGKGKAMKVVAEAGTFFTEHQSDEVDENGKKKWEKTELGTEIEATIFYRRKQLKFFDGTSYTSSPVYDSDDQIIPLFKDKAEVDRGTPAELKARPMYQGVSAKGKPISKLEENRVLYVLYAGQVYQTNVRGTSMYAFMTYSKGITPPTVLTRISSEAKENGSISWSQMTFETVRVLDENEAREVLLNVREVEKAIEQEKAFFANKESTTTANSPEEKTLALEVEKF